MFGFIDRYYASVQLNLRQIMVHGLIMIINGKKSVRLQFYEGNGVFQNPERAIHYGGGSAEPLVIP